MADLDDYVAQQAAQQAKNRGDAVERKRLADEEWAKASQRESYVFDRDVLGPLKAAALSLKAHVETSVKTSTLGRSAVATLNVGLSNNPKQILLSVQQNATVYNVKVAGIGKPTSVENAVLEANLPAHLAAAIKDVIDRWFGTNQHQN